MGMILCSVLASGMFQALNISKNKSKKLFCALEAQLCKLRHLIWNVILAFNLFKSKEGCVFQMIKVVIK